MAARCNFDDCRFAVLSILAVMSVQSSLSLSSLELSEMHTSGGSKESPSSSLSPSVFDSFRLRRLRFSPKKLLMLHSGCLLIGLVCTYKHILLVQKIRKHVLQIILLVHKPILCDGFSCRLGAKSWTLRREYICVVATSVTRELPTLPTNYTSRVHFFKVLTRDPLAINCS